jgi:hypothetical protein
LGTSAIFKLGIGPDDDDDDLPSLDFELLAFVLDSLPLEIFVVSTPFVF